LFKRDKKDRKTFLIYRKTNKTMERKERKEKEQTFRKIYSKEKENEMEKNRFIYNHRKDLPLSIVVDV
jgi:formylmethanofuran dehydrogenase subunit A